MTAESTAGVGIDHEGASLRSANQPLEPGLKGEGECAPHYLVFDVESVGLHGEGFAVGMVLLAPDGTEKACGQAWVHPDEVRGGYPADRAWIAENVVPHLSPLYCLKSVREVRDALWFAWSMAPKGTRLAADVAWPVEARFLAACIDDNPRARNWGGPYPLIDIASVRLAAGCDPLAVEPRHANELPAHNPLNDARQSARLLFAALAAIEVPA